MFSFTLQNYRTTMCQLIIGNVTENTAKIWVKGAANNQSTSTITAQITLKSDLHTVIQNLTIYKHNNFIGVFEFDDLNPSDSGLIRTLYTVNVVFKDEEVILEKLLESQKIIDILDDLIADKKIASLPDFKSLNTLSTQVRLEISSYHFIKTEFEKIIFKF